jgi:hypothetical protein
MAAGHGGNLSDQGWRGATRVEKWYEANPGDNTEPNVKNVGYLTYDDRFLYAGFEFDDPNPHAIRAPYADRDDIGNRKSHPASAAPRSKRSTSLR